MAINILDLLRKLMAHEKSCRTIGNIKEAEAFAARIQSLMDEHRLGMTDVDFTDREETEPISWTHVDSTDEGFTWQKSRRLWQVRLGQALAYCNSCQCVLSRKNGNALSFVGRTSDREFCKVLFIYLLELAEHLNELSCQQEHGQMKFDYVNSLRPDQDWDIHKFNAIMRSFKTSWYEGFSEAVCLRLYDEHRKRRDAAKAAGTTALVHINADAIAVKNYLKGATRKTSGGRRPREINMHGFARGKAQGNAINLSPSRFGDTTGRTARLLPG
jgi:hypothetical protein